MFTTENSGSEVGELMCKRSNEAWHEWRKHIAAGSVATPEAIKAWEDSKLANDTLIGELIARSEAVLPARAR